MGPGETFAAIAQVLGVICLAAIVMEGYSRRLRARTADKELEVRRIEALAAAGAPEAVEQRLRVLERIATDPARTIAADIEDLRRHDAREGVY